MRCSHFLQPSTTCCGSPPGRRSSTAGRGRASPAGCSPPCRRDWRLRSRRMGDEQRVSWQELLAQSRFENFVRNFYRVHSDYQVKRENIYWRWIAADQVAAGFLPKMQTDISLTSHTRKIIINYKLT